MIEENIQNFITKNKEAFAVLQRHIKSIDTVHGVDTVTEFKARQKAIRIINGWLTELWGIAYPELPEDDEEDDIFRTVANS